MTTTLKTILVISCTALLSPTMAQIKIKTLWANGDPTQSGLFMKWSLPYPYSATTYSNGTETGVRFELRQTDSAINSGHRAELYHLTDSTFHWVSFKDSIPLNFNKDNTEMCVMQMPINTAYMGKYKATISGPIGISILNSKWMLRQHYQNIDVKTLPPVVVSTDLGDVEYGKAVTWSIYVNWSLGASGIIKVYKNGKLFVTKCGPNCNNEDGKMMNSRLIKFGIYNWNKMQVYNKVHFISKYITAGWRTTLPQLL